MYETTLAILHKVALPTHTYLLCVSVSQYLNVQPIGPDTTLLYLLPYSYYINDYTGVFKMRRCSSLFRFSIERVSAYALISFEMESVNTADHCDLTSKSNFHSLKSEHIVTMPGSFVEVCLQHIMFTATIVSM